MARGRLILAAGAAALTALAFVPTSGAAPSQPAQSSSGRPVLHAISPTAVPAAGALIAVGGSRLDQVHSVSFGHTVVHQVVHVSSTRLTVEAPKHALGWVSVTLHSANGPSHSVQLNYARPPAPLHWHGNPDIDPRHGELIALSCVTELFCVAVEDDPHTPTRLLRFGTDIAPKSTSVPASAHVASVACGSNHFCVAGPATGAYIWNGTRWRGPTRLGNNLPNGPTCARGTGTCLYYSATRTLIHKASGWTDIPLPGALTVTAVSCGSAKFCEAVAGDKFGHYDGTKWRIDTAAPPSDGYQNIACAAPRYCLATGHYSAELTGSTWTEKSVQPGRLASLDCAVPHHCVGLYVQGFKYGPSSLGGTQVFGGWAWTFKAIPTSSVRVPGLSCPSTSLCRAVDVQGRSFDLAHGRWKPRQLVPASGDLRTISCASRRWCMARDVSGNALRWQDGHWSKPQPIDIGHGRFGRTTISCSPDRFCAAVSQVYGSASPKMIRYVHGRWQRPQPMNLEFKNPYIGPGDISCPASGYCVVTTYNGRLFTYDHGAWTTSLRLARHLGAVDCSSPKHCVIDAGQDTLVSRGSSWQSVPAIIGQGNEASVVDCVEARFCLGNAFFDLADLHDGVWGRLAGVHPGVQACAARTFCVAEAYSKPFDEGSRFEETFNGSAVRRSKYQGALAIDCAPGPMCIELTKYSARVGRP